MRGLESLERVAMPCWIDQFPFQYCSSARLAKDRARARLGERLRSPSAAGTGKVIKVEHRQIKSAECSNPTGAWILVLCCSSEKITNGSITMYSYSR